MSRALPRLVFGSLALAMTAAAPPPLIDKRGDVEARATVDAAETRLSGEITLTVAITAPAPLTVTPPKTLLTKPNLWRARADGPPKQTTDGDRETWTQVYRLSPLITGKPEIALGAFAVRGGDGKDAKLDWNSQSLSVAVRTTVESPSTESLRPTTNIEELPAVPANTRGTSPWLFAIVPALLLLAGIGVYFGRRKRAPPVKRDAEWALAELQAVDLTADRCATILRQYVAYRFGLPAEARTTPELTEALRSDGRLQANHIDEWQSLLSECDTVRFSGIPAGLAGLTDRARHLISAAEEDCKNQSSQSTPVSQTAEID